MILKSNLSEKLKLSEIIVALSSSLDMSKQKLLSHSQKVAYIALEFASYLALDHDETSFIVLAALLHDIGIEQDEIKREIQENFYPDSEIMYAHCLRGYHLSNNIRCFNNMSKVILSHHDTWAGENFTGLVREQIPLASRIINLADRVEISIHDKKNILLQKEEIIERINKHSGKLFDPDLVNLFNVIASKEYFWLNISSGQFINKLNLWSDSTNTQINISDLEEIAFLFASIIDKKSPFTSRHSAGVATIAAMIASDLGASFEEQRIFRVAGLLHDLGKQIIPSSILEKPAALTDDEFKIVRQHTYYTFIILNQIKGMGNIPLWAANHHEKLDGSGYPFHYNKNQLDLGSRIMMVADIFQALTEDRPYRKAMSIADSLSLLYKLARKEAIDINIVKLLQELV